MEKVLTETELAELRGITKHYPSGIVGTGFALRNMSVFKARENELLRQHGINPDEYCVDLETGGLEAMHYVFKSKPLRYGLQAITLVGVVLALGSSLTQSNATGVFGLLFFSGYIGLAFLCLIGFAYASSFTTHSVQWHQQAVD